MPPVAKMDLVPEKIRRWLKAELKKRGFGGYEEVAEALNERLREEGSDLTIGKSTLAAFGADVRDYVKLQRESQDEMRAFLREQAASSDIDVADALHQQLSTIQYRLQKAATLAGDIDPKGVKDLSTAMNNLLRSTQLREKIAEDVERKLRAEQKRAMDEKMGAAVAAGDAAERAALERAREIMGFG